MAIEQNLWNFQERRSSNLANRVPEPCLHHRELGDGGQSEHVRGAGLGGLHAKHAICGGDTGIQIQQVSRPW